MNVKVLIIMYTQDLLTIPSIKAKIETNNESCHNNNIFAPPFSLVFLQLIPYLSTVSKNM